MDKTVAGILGAVSALAVTQAQGAPAAAPTMNATMDASSYADLLRPIPNALDLLAAEPAEPEPLATVQPVQWHHHHHHHHWHGRWWHHHHHHWYPYGYNPYGYYGGYYGYGYNPYAYGYNPYTGY